MTTNKTCIKCKTVKTLNDFYSKGAKCKECRRIQVKLLQVNYPERHKSRMRARRMKDPKFYSERTSEWIQKNRAHVNAIKAKRRVELDQATPQWANLSLIEEFYELAKMRTDETGIQHEVDHIIPRKGKLVSGLHVENNLQILTKLENSRKRNNFSGDEE